MMIVEISPNNDEPAFNLPFIEKDFEITDALGKLPLDAFDEINDDLADGAKSGMAYSLEREITYSWELK